MEVTNPLYRNQGIHVIAVLFTVEKGVPKILLIKRKNEPFKGLWALVGGALYNNETVEEGMKREIKEKTGIENVPVFLFDVFSEVNRSPVMRMVALAYLGIVDSSKIKLLKETEKTTDSEWFPIGFSLKLAYDHEKILQKGIEVIKKKIFETDILRILYPNGFTIPEIQKTYEGILNVKFDRRNFRKKLLNLGLIQVTHRVQNFEGKKPAKVYQFKKIKESKNVF